jgi:nucleotide-binding universal stress UspA family protein
MSIRTVLAPLSGSDTCQSGLEAAARTAKAFGAHLIALHVRMDPAAAVPFIADGLTADIVQELVSSAESEGQRRADKAKSIFEAVCSQFSIPIGLSTEGPSAEWMERQGPLGDTVGRMARIADLTAVPKPDSDADPLSAGMLDDVLTRSGRAVLVTPHPLPERLSQNILIAWDGSAEAARAVADAMPFLERSDKATILTVGGIRDERPDGATLAHSLSAHGVKAEVKTLPKNDGVGEIILQTAEDMGATLVVLGAYSHSRWRELVLGGVTRTVIDKAKLAVLMSH